MNRPMRAWPVGELERRHVPPPRAGERAPILLAAPHEPLFPVRLPAATFGTAAGRWRRFTPAWLLNRLKRPFSRWSHARSDAAIVARHPRPALPMMPASDDVCIIGAVGARNGLGRAARYERDHLLERYPKATVIEVSKADRTALAAFAAARRGRPPTIVIFLMQPNLMAALLGDVEPGVFARAYRIGLAVWELPYFPPGWETIDAFFHEYWTPSSHSADALRRGTANRVVVMPHPVRLPRPATPRILAPEAPFGGLAVMDLSTCPDRKNPWAHIEAWQKAFGDDPQCVLTLKLRFSRRTRMVRRELRRMIGSATNIRILEAEMDDLAMMQLQVANDVCLSLHRAEGFGLTICEMLELGKAAVATGWSGNSDFMGRYVNAYPVRYEMVPYRDYLDRYHGFVGDWAEADTDHAARCLRVVAVRARRAAREHRRECAPERFCSPRG